MPPTGRPHRSSTAASRMPAMNNQIAELRSLADELIAACQASPPTSSVLQTQSNALRRMRQLLIESHEETHTKDAFRYVRGFEVLLQTLRSLSGFYVPANLSQPDRIDFFDVIKASLDVLSDALESHSGNRRFFAKRVEAGGGWAALEQALASTGICGRQSDTIRDDAGQEQLFGNLFAFAMGEESMTRIFRDIEKAAIVESSGPDDPESDSQINLEALRSHIRSLFSGTEILQNPDILPIIIHFWCGLSGADAPGTRSKALSLSVLLAILNIIRLSTYNKAAIHVTGVLSTILPLLFDNKCGLVEAGLLRDVADDLIEYGISRLEDAYYLFRKAASSSQAADFLYKGMRISRGAPFIQFDLSLSGFSAVELPDIGRPFPPVSPGSGYTFAAWIRVDKYDPNCHTTIFGAYDDTQTCFLMAYLEKDTRCFILQTYMGHSAGVVPSVRFKKAPRFEQGSWYHLAVVHRRAKAIGLGAPQASLYINGEFTETMRAHYPSHPPVLDGSQESFASVNSHSSRQHHILAFLGTPRNLAPRLGRNVLQSKLSIASLHLFSEPISDELIAVYHKLGPRYCGNFQDRLGSFQTYRTSAELNVHNEILHPGKEERSDIISAIQSNAGDLVPESKILLSFSPNSVLDDDDRNAIDESQLIRSLSKDSAKALHRYTRMHGNPIIINAAVPSVNDALSQLRGFGRLSGDPVVVVPQSLDDAIWRVGGCAAVGIKLIQYANTLEGILRSVKILLEAVEGNWRNCEAMEQNSGFALLAEVLRQKVGSGPGFGGRHNLSGLDTTPEECEAFILKLLRVILRFVGYNEANPTESLIINPLAYRVLLVDLEIWRKSTSLETQKLYYTQFVDFAKGSKHHHYNAKRFNRIRVVKRLTDALKSESFAPPAFPYFLKAFKVLLEINFNGENARSVSLFVTYALHDGRAAYAKRTLRPRTSALRLRRAASPAVSSNSTPRSASPIQDPSQPPGLPLGELGVSILKMLAELLCDGPTHHDIIRFAKNVSGKWLLYLLGEPDRRVVLLAAKILSRLLVANGPLYVKKFTDKGGGFVVMKNRLRHWWNTPGVWTVCFSILFDRDVSGIDFERNFDVFNLVDIFIANAPRSRLRIVYPEILPVIAAMLDTGLRTIVRDPGNSETGTPAKELGEPTVTRGRRRTMSLTAPQPPTDPRAPQSERLNDYAAVLNTAIQFLSELHSRCEAFRDYAISSNYVQELLFVLYPIVVTSDGVSAETELLSRGSALTFEGHDVVIKPLSKSTGQQSPIVRTTSVSLSPSPVRHHVAPLRRASSFVLVSSERPASAPKPSLLSPQYSSLATSVAAMQVGSGVVEALLEVVLAVFQDQLFNRKDFSGLGLFLKTPPGFQEHQAYFESYIFRQTISSVMNALQLDQRLLHEPRVLSNLSRFVTHISEAVFEGWFLGGADSLLDFAGFLLEYLERPDVAQTKSVRLCTLPISVIRNTFLRVVLLRLAESDDTDRDSSTASTIKKMIYWQPIILSSENSEGVFLRLICYLLYTKLSSRNEALRSVALDFWRLALVQKPDDTYAILTQAPQGDRKSLHEGFQKLTELDNETFLQWFDQHRAELDAFFYGTMSKAWEDFAHEQNKKTEETAQRRLAKRKEKLKQWQNDDLYFDRVWTSHENSTNHWRSNIHASERIKHQRVLQDQQDNINFLGTVMARLEKQLRGPCALFESSPVPKWRLDETEGRDRKRMRTIIDTVTREQNYQPKRKDTDPGNKALKLDTAVPTISTKDAVGVTPVDAMRPSSSRGSPSNKPKDDGSNSDIEEEFEMVEAMYEDEDGFEDKNRKVMRSLNRGDQVQHVCNVSRVIGLEAIEGLLIVGKDCLYLLDDFFQRSDGEIVRVWQAPIDERDPYVQIIAGKKAITNRRPPARDEGEVSRNWKWNEVISFSKRRFLHRDVAIEVFFDDGRSYLLTAMSPSARNDLYLKLMSRAQYVAKPDLLSHSEISWRLDCLRNPEETPQTLGSRFASAFGSTSSHPATKKWLKGEISNFHYLMLINTLAGRSFNDLTQYPVFPWVLADYTSDELDLNNPAVFRDLSKPIGCQDPTRERKVRERYRELVEMGDQAFHHGTHYSSAMTVASYLVRLQPFCGAFTLIQGGGFDHADRMFYSVASTWDTVSRTNMADSRELTPEFYYLPECLTNLNGYNFGLRASGESVDNVELPPWAKGDPAIFIAKQREALESPYVSENLHRWIDLIFGYQQRGEAAVEAGNVFHHTTYQGSVDIDQMGEVERERHISAINNFGQTPIQVFQRPHPQKDIKAGKLRRLDTTAESLTRVPGTLLEANDRISSLAYITKSDKLLCSAPFRHNIPPHYERYMEWGFTDGSVRFYDSNTKRLVGLFEHLHCGQLTTSLFVDSKTLITAGTDCTVAVWNVIKNEKKNTIDMTPSTMLFGHRSPVVTLAASAAFAAFLSASGDGRVFMWDLNRLEFVRELDLGPAQKRNPIPVQAARINSVTGHIVLACGPRLIVTTLNGRLLMEQDVCVGDEDADGITAVAVYEGVGNEWCERELIFTGHRRGTVKIFHLAPDRTGAWTITLLKILNHTDNSREDGGNYAAPITCILPMPQNVYTGDDDGRVYEWDCVYRHD